MHLVSDISESTQQMDCGYNFSADISDWLHIGNVQDVYRSTNKFNYIQQIVKHNNQGTGLDYIEGTLTYIARQGCHDIDTAKIFSLQSDTDKHKIIRQAHP
jgi:hypothetical protein